MTTLAHVCDYTTADVVISIFSNMYAQNKPHAIKEMFALRNPAGGGNKKQFYVCTRWIIENEPSAFMEIINNIPVHGTYKDVLVVSASTSVEEQVIKWYVSVLKNDLQKLSKQYNNDAKASSVSNAARYAPTKGCVLDRAHCLVSKFVRAFDITGRQYRKEVLAPLRAAIARRPPTAYIAIANNIPYVGKPAPARELIKYYLAGKPFSSAVEAQWREHVSVYQPGITPRADPCSVYANVLLMLETQSRFCLINVVSMANHTINLQDTLETKVRAILRAYDPRGTNVNIDGLVYDLSLSHMLG